MDSILEQIMKAIPGLASLGPVGYGLIGLMGVLTIGVFISKVLAKIKAAKKKLGSDMKDGSDKVTDEVKDNKDKIDENRGTVDDFTGRS